MKIWSHIITGTSSAGFSAADTFSQVNIGNLPLFLPPAPDQSLQLTDATWQEWECEMKISVVSAGTDFFSPRNFQSPDSDSQSLNIPQA